MLPSPVLLLLAAGLTTAQKPLLGFNTYNAYACSPNSSTTSSSITHLSSLGLHSLGYTYFQLDCGWASRDDTRNATTGALAIDTDRFPDGLAGLADLARSNGLVWSMYSDAGVRMCDTQVPSPVAGSLGYEGVDAELFKSFGSEYVKYDNCYADGPTAADNAPKAARTDFITRYDPMAEALDSVGIHLLLVCQWGVPYLSDTGRILGPSQWTQNISTSYRLSDDIADAWSNVYRIYNEALHVLAAGRSGPGHVGDADLLEVGNSGMTITEQATHFAIWAMIKSALMISTDLATISQDAFDILSNKALIAINQDDLGEPVHLVQRFTDDYDVLVGSLSNGDLAVLVVDLSGTARTLTLHLEALNLTSATVTNLWTSTTTSATGPYSSSVQAHGSLALRLSNTVAATPKTKTVTYTPASSGTLTNGAATAACPGCTTTSSLKVGNIGGPSNGTVTLTLPASGRTSSTQTLLFNYINADIGYLGGTDLNERLAGISVNGGATQNVSFPISGWDWGYDVWAGYRVKLDGFKTNGGENVISIFGMDGGWAPDLESVGVIVV